MRQIIGHVSVEVMVEVSGCPTTCMHCWALGRSYRAMPIGDAAFFLDELSGFCAERGLDYTSYPMHEVTAHPDAPEMIRLFAPHLGQGYDPILTPGTPLASRPDWQEIITAARQCGAHALWVAFHGYGAEHDRQRKMMGDMANHRPASALLLLITVIITGLNVYLLYGSISGLF